VGSEEVEIVSAPGGESAALPEPEPPPQALRRAIAITTIMVRKGLRIKGKRREFRVIGFMGLELPIFARGISREMFSGLISRLANGLPN
jgi:hypothetical protein